MTRIREMPNLKNAVDVLLDRFVNKNLVLLFKCRIYIITNEKCLRFLIIQ